jgi:formylaminopyrimidine deformylase / aminopyrimidine aminohydrolase
MSAVEQLEASAAGLWQRIPAHPFVTAAADGSLPGEAFDRWIVEDHHFVVGFRRFLGRLLEVTAEEEARDLLAGGIAALTPELELFRGEARHRGLSLDTEPGPTTLGYTAYIQAAPADGAMVGWAVLYGAEKAYHDAWLAVRATAQESSPYWRFIDNWSSAAFGEYVTAIGRGLDRLAGDGPLEPAVMRAFSRVVRFELRFWDAVHAGERW